MSSSARRRLPLVLFCVFLITPIVEIYVLIQVGHLLGAGPTILIVLASAFLGAWLVKREGKRAWEALRTALSSGRMPNRELADGALILIGGTLMIAPGLITDALGFLMVVPVTRPFFRPILGAFISRRMLGTTGVGFPAGFSSGFPGAPQRPRPDEHVVPGEVIDPD